jgi:aminopeptidase N
LIATNDESMKALFNLILLGLCFPAMLQGQAYLERFRSLDVKKYELHLQVNDSTDRIDAHMLVHMNFRRSVDSFALNLVSLDSLTGKGMAVDSIRQNDILVDFTHNGDLLNIEAKHVFPGITYTYHIYYKGIPKDGLVIGENLFGDRTFFGDNWPNRAQHWFPCVDHPSDKAYFETHVTAPQHYQVVANGSLLEQTNLNNGLNYFKWQTNVPLPTKVMVVGIARFAVQNIGNYSGVPVSTWVYPQNKEEGFVDFSNAGNILDFFVELIAPYPFMKLANVQSKTRFGGMENAGNIFYFERSVNGKQEREELIAHEIAHQWFGNSASEIDWAHVWLSEGFATYLTAMYVEHSKGKEAFKATMDEDRGTVLDYYQRSKTPVIDSRSANFMRLLNANSYQKGSWVLHMLRKQVGDDLFLERLRAYYNRYKLGNADTDDFRRVMEAVSKQDLTTFFDQWLYRSGHPVLKTQWIYADNKVRMIIDQSQETSFDFLLALEFILKDGSSEIKTVDVRHKSAPFVIEVSGEVKEVRIDPHSWLLHELSEN